jgi:hypothetical protein
MWNTTINEKQCVYVCLFLCITNLIATDKILPFSDCNVHLKFYGGTLVEHCLRQGFTSLPFLKNSS